MVTKKGTNKDDKLSGTSGDDVLIGLGGNDLLVGLNGDDTLLGNEGNDILLGYAGFDSYVGGAGSDVFVLGGGGGASYLGAGYATIQDWNPLEDFITVDASLLPFYTINIGDYGAGTSALDTEILFQGDTVAVVADSAAFVLFLASDIILTGI